MAESIKIEGGGDGILIAGGIFIFFVIILLVVWAMNPDMFKKKEGDDCKVNDGDIRGTYEIDDKGKCVLKSCDTGWRVDGKKCTKILESIGGDEVPAPADPAPADPAPAGPAPAGPAPVDPNYKLYPFKTRDYGDLPLWDGRMMGEGKTLEECKTKCSSTPVCLGLTYQPASKKCWLKGESALSMQPSTDNNFYEKKGYSNPYTKHEYRDREGGDLALWDGNTTGENKTVEECKIKCHENSDCIGVSYQPYTKKCWLKNSSTGVMKFSSDNHFYAKK